MKKMFILALFVLTALFLTGCETDPDATYGVHYLGNGNTSGYPPVDNNEYKSGEEAAVLGRNSLLRDGYTFQGWNTRADGSGASYNPDDKIKIGNLHVFLYAVWAPEVSP